MAPPFGFSNDLARWVSKRCVSGVVSCEFVPVAPQARARMNVLHPVPEDDAEGQDTLDRASHRSIFVTGFLMFSDAYGVYVLTCAHAIEYVFNAAHPITANQAAELYEPHIVCNHRERRFRNGLDLNRAFARGIIYRIDTARDLLLVRIPRYLFEVHYCTHDHMFFPIARNFPASLKTVVMVSWPPLRNKTKVIGEVSHKGRSHRDLARNNPQNYHMLLSEVRINSDEGSSGAPLVDGDVEVAGVLHGGQGGFSYFVSLPDMRAALIEWGMPFE